MSNYLRPIQPGASIFFTVTLAQRGSELLVAEIEALRQAVRQTRFERPFGINAWVVLPDHLHCVWTLPPGDADYANRWRIIKARVSRSVPLTQRSRSNTTRREHGLWQRRFWEHHIRDSTDLGNHISYCWQNPVKHGLVTDPAHWPYSTYHRDHA